MRANVSSLIIIVELMNVKAKSRIALEHSFDQVSLLHLVLYFAISSLFPVA